MEIKRTVYPLARGTRRRSAQRDRIFGLSRWRGEHAIFITDRYRHPGLSRWRGEHVFCGINVGSSTVYPAGAGTPRSPNPIAPSARFILAGAGNTLVNVASVSLLAVYPLARGTRRISDLLLEHERFIRWRGEHWGKPRPVLRGAVYLAGAGNTLINRDRQRCGLVYPLAREHTMQKCRRYRPCGLSAGAGNTRQIQPARLSAWFIPLAREHTLPYRTNQMMHGLSAGAGNTAAGVAGQENLRFIPLARGTRQHSIRNAGFNRFIRWRGEHVNWNIL
ncbi:hypothetical protein JS565_12670 [Salmonella enterica subsp. enterica serovar Senftenberg]|nr:hypothetical protein [Salmonella enterica subsp. enterica serovar Senftenberg]